jgi:hypothetical protein
VEWNGETYQRYSFEDGAYNISVNVVSVHGNHVWMGGSGGVLFFSKGNFHLLNRKSEGAMGVTGLVETDAGELWLNGPGGVSRISSEEINKWLRDPTYAVADERFGAVDGLPGTASERWPEPSAIRSGETIWFASTNGVSFIDPSAFRKGRNSKPPQVYINSAVSDDKTYSHFGPGPRAIALGPGPLLLVGHSYGGAVITQAGNDPKVEGLLYVNAFAPDTGESAYGLGNTVPAQVASEIRPDAGGYLKLTTAGITDDFAQELTGSEKANLMVTQGPINATDALGGVITTPAWKGRPSWYIIGSNDRVISPSLEATMAARIKATTITLTSCHVSLLAHPTDVTAFIEKAAATLAP